MFKNDRHNGDGFGAGAAEAGSASEVDARTDIFLGRTSPVEARLYVRRRDAAAGETLAGYVRGPVCRYANTLPVNYALRQLPADGAGEVLAEAVVPEPCFWTPDMPQTYELHLDPGQHSAPEAPRMLGIRSLGARGRDLLFSGRRWVLRGVRSAAVEAAQLADWREAGAAMVVSEPGDALCEEASHVGVVLVAMLRRESSQPLEELRRLGRWPAVALATVEAETPAAAALAEELRRAPMAARHAAPNLLLGMIVPQQTLAAATFSPPPGLDVVLVEVDRPEMFGESIARVSQPVVAMRASRGATSAGLAEARRACDELQKDLAPGSDCAGYVV